MPVRGAQKDVFELFMRNKSEFAVDPEPEERSNRVIMPDATKARLKERRLSASAADLRTAVSPAAAAAKNPVAAADDDGADEGLGGFLRFPAAAAPTSAADYAGAAVTHLPLPPWARERYEQYLEDHARLHEEIVDWMGYMEPRPAECALRNRLVNRLVDMLQRGKDALFPEAKVHVFGSMRTGLLVPASDVDICIDHVTSCDIQTALERISSRLEVVGLASEKPRYIQAKVPIVKFIDGVSGLECDCSVNAIGGRQNSAIVSQLLDAYPPSRPLILIIKTFLRQRKLNEVFTGGLSTYSISLMVIHLLQIFHGGEADRRRVSLGKLLIDFFHLYGYMLDYDHVVLSVTGGGSYIPKERFRPAREAMEINRRKGQPTLRLAIEDPQNPSNDVSGGSREIHHIRTAFKQAFLALTSPGAAAAGPGSFDCYVDHPLILRRPTLLNRILTSDHDLLIRRDALEAAYEKYLETEGNPADEVAYCSDFEDDTGYQPEPDRSSANRKRPRSPVDRHAANGHSPHHPPHSRRRY